jgi:hypothetical protein
MVDVSQSDDDFDLSRKLVAADFDLTRKCECTGRVAVVWIDSGDEQVHGCVRCGRYRP